MYGENEQSLRVTFQPTDKCNLKCSYCYQNNKGSTDLHINQAKHLLDKIFEHDQEYFRGFLHDDYLNIILDFIGGEATLCMDFINEITDYFIQCCIKFGKTHWLLNIEIWLQTNGTTYFQPKVQKYIKKHVDRLELPITLDGSKNCHDACRKYFDGRGSYDDVYKAMHHYINTYHKYPNTKITISPDNIHSMFDAIKAMIDMGFNGVRLSCVNEDVWRAEHDDVFREQLEKYYYYIERNNIEFDLYPYSIATTYMSEIQTGSCGAYGNMICLDCNGKLYLCQRFTEITNLNGKPSLSIGNIEDGITDGGLKIIEAIKDSRDITKDTEQCRDCAIGAACETCPAFMYEHFGKANGVMTVNCRKMHIAHELLLQHCARIQNATKYLLMGR